MSAVERKIVDQGRRGGAVEVGLPHGFLDFGFRPDAVVDTHLGHAAAERVARHCSAVAGDGAEAECRDTGDRDRRIASDQALADTVDEEFDVAVGAVVGDGYVGPFARGQQPGGAGHVELSVVNLEAEAVVGKPEPQALIVDEVADIGDRLVADQVVRPDPGLDGDQARTVDGIDLIEADQVVTAIEDEVIAEAV